MVLTQPCRLPCAYGPGTEGTVLRNGQSVVKPGLRLYTAQHMLANDCTIQYNVIYMYGWGLGHC